MSSRILVITAVSASLLAVPMLALAQGYGATSTGTTGTTSPGTAAPSGSMGTTTTPATGSSGMGMGSAQQMPASGSADMGSFNPRNYRTPTDCLNAASAAHVALSACGEHRGR